MAGLTDTGLTGARPSARLTGAWLRRVASSPHASRLILRGSLLTQQWVPERPAADVDHVLDPEGTPDEARSIVDEVLALPDPEPLPPARHEVIWANTPWPGHRTTLGEGEDALQIDVGSGDPLAAPTAHVEVLGVRARAVRAETMYAWKVHGLVELGLGRWRPKDLFDLLLLGEHVPLDEALLVPSLRLAFDSRGNRLDELDRFLRGPWGESRGSRRRWEKFQETYAGPHPVPSLLDVRDAVRVHARPRVAAAAALPPLDPSR